MEIESEDHLRQFVQEHDTVIVSCFPSSKDVEPELLGSLTSTLLCRINLNTVRASGLLLPDDQEGEEDDGMNVRQEGWWIFFRGGEMVRAVPVFSFIFPVSGQVQRGGCAQEAAANMLPRNLRRQQ